MVNFTRKIKIKPKHKYVMFLSFGTSTFSAESIGFATATIQFQPWLKLHILPEAYTNWMWMDISAKAFFHKHNAL